MILRASEPLVITKELILKKVREETLMEHYLGIPVKKGLFRSPLRRDANPTCSFHRNKRGDLIFKDFDGSFYGNFISVVMHKFNCSYYSALQIIANDFGIISRPKLVKNEAKIPYSNSKFEESGPAIIQVEIQPFQQNELNY